MATKKDIKEEINEIEPGVSGITMKVEEKESKFSEEDYVPVYLPELPDSGDGMKVDKYEHVTMANEIGEDCYKIIRGEWTRIPWPVYVTLKQGRYPKI